MNKLILLVFCHLVGDYVLQNDFIAKNKGSNWYHLFVHCALYCLPFYLAFGLTWQLGVVFLTHCIIDPLKARYQRWINDYFSDYTWKTLSTCASYFNYQISEDAFHNSLEDVKATLFCFFEMNDPELFLEWT